MLASAEAETSISVPFMEMARMALTKSPCPKNRLAGCRDERDHDQMDLSQQPAKTVSDLGETAIDVRGAIGPEKVADISPVYAMSQLCCPKTSERRQQGLRKRCLTDFNVDSLHVSRCFGHIDLVLILGIRRKGQDLGRELDRSALCVLGLGGLAGSLIQSRAVTS